MAITISIDNDRLTAGIQSLLEDESTGVQTPVTTDDGNEIDVLLSNPVGGSLSGFLGAFNTFVNGTMFTAFTLSDAQKVYAAAKDGASSSTDLVKVTVTGGETVSDLFFSDSSGNALDGDQVVGMQTLSGDNVYLYSNGDFCIATTSATAGAGRIVAAFYLNESVDHLTGQVQMVAFEPLKHLDTASTDEGLNFTNVLQVSAAGSQSFDFDALKSGEALWVAVGSPSAAILVSGYSLDVDAAGKKTNTSDKIHVSQGGTGTTIGLNNQLFDNAGETAVFTLVTGLDSLAGADSGAQSDYVIDHTGPKADGIDYSGYINVTGAGIFVSQSQGNSAKSFDINLFTAGGGTTPEEGFAYIGTEPSGAFQDDTPVNVATVTVIDDDGDIVGTWGAGGLASGTTVNGNVSANGVANVQVSISGNNIDVNGVLGEYTVKWTSTGGTFNRFTMVSEAGQFDVGRVDLTQGVSTHEGIGGNLVVEDDGPSPSGVDFVRHVDEDAMTGAAGSDGSTGIVDNPDDGDGIAGEQDEVTFNQSDLAITINSGTDIQALFSLVSSFAAGTAVKTTTGSNVFSKGSQLFWTVSGGEVRGVADAGARVVFSISVNTQGNADPSDDTFTFDLKDQLDHGNGAGELANLLLDITPGFTATDADLDPVAFGTTKIVMQVENDTPTITAQIEDGTVKFVADATGTVTKSLNGAIGADDTNATNTSQTPSIKQYTITSWTEPHNVFPDLDGVLSTDGTKVTYYSTSVTADQNASTAVYELSLNQTANSGAGSYTFTVLKAPPVVQQNFDFTDLPSGQNLLGVIAVDKADLTKGGLLVIPTNPDLDGTGAMTNISGTVNTSKGGGPVTIGNENQAFDHTDEGAFFCYVDNPVAGSVGGVGLTQTSADNANTADFDGTNEATRASVEIVQASGKGTAARPGPALQITAYDINPQTVGHLGDAGVETDSVDFVLDPTATDEQVKIISVKILDANGNVVEFRTNNDAGATNGGTLAGGSSDSPVGISFVLDNPNAAGTADDDYSVLVSNLKAGYTVEFATDTGHDLAKVQHVSGSYDIGGFNIFNSVDLPAQDFDFSVQVNDYDNDAYGGTGVPFANFSVTIDALTF